MHIASLTPSSSLLPSLEDVGVDGVAIAGKDIIQDGQETREKKAGAQDIGVKKDGVVGVKSGESPSQSRRGEQQDEYDFSSSTLLPPKLYDNDAPAVSAAVDIVKGSASKSNDPPPPPQSGTPRNSIDYTNMPLVGLGSLADLGIFSRGEGDDSASETESEDEGQDGGGIESCRRDLRDFGKKGLAGQDSPQGQQGQQGASTNRQVPSPGRQGNAPGREAVSSNSQETSPRGGQNKQRQEQKQQEQQQKPQQNPRRQQERAPAQNSAVLAPRLPPNIPVRRRRSSAAHSSSPRLPFILLFIATPKPTGTPRRTTPARSAGRGRCRPGTAPRSTRSARRPRRSSGSRAG